MPRKITEKQIKNSKTMIFWKNKKVRSKHKKKIRYTSQNPVFKFTAVNIPRQNKTVKQPKGLFINQ